MRQKLWYCQATDTIRTAENMLLLFRNKSVWSNTWLITFDHAVDDKLVQLTYKYLQQATGFTKDGQIMANGLNEFISRNTYSEKVFSVGGRRSGRTTRLVDDIIQRLFIGEMVTVADHYMDGKDKYTNNNLVTKVFDRLASEHNIGPSSLIIESKDSIQIKFK